MNYTQLRDTINSYSVKENNFSMSSADYRFIPEAIFSKKLFEIVNKVRTGQESAG